MAEKTTYLYPIILIKFCFYFTNRRTGLRTSFPFINDGLESITSFGLIHHHNITFNFCSITWKLQWRTFFSITHALSMIYKYFCLHFAPYLSVQLKNIIPRPAPRHSYQPTFFYFTSWKSLYILSPLSLSLHFHCEVQQFEFIRFFFSCIASDRKWPPPPAAWCSIHRQKPWNYSELCLGTIHNSHT